MGKIAIAASCLALMAAPTLAATGADLQKGESKVRELLLLMDKDQNGKVSRDEFMAFMTSEFDRLDVNKDGELDVTELQALRVAPKHPGGSGSK